MLQRAFYEMYEELDLDALFRLTEEPMIGQLLEKSGNGPAGELLNGLFGPARRIYKRLSQFSLIEDESTYQLLARRPYPWLIRCAEELARILSQQIGQRVAPHEVLFDAPPMGLEVQFNIQVHYPKQETFRWLGDVSPVVKALATKQFDDFVKRVRIFVHPRIRTAASRLDNISELVIEAANRTES
jgi:hypothetical protein